MHQRIQFPERTGAGQKTGSLASIQQVANLKGFA
jgi:hypothetical protein